HSRGYIDLFDALNRMLVFNLPCHLSLLRYNGKGLRFPQFSTFFKSTDQAPPTTIRTPFQRVFGPIRGAECTGDLGFAISPLVVALWPKSAPIFAFFDLFYIH